MRSKNFIVAKKTFLFAEYSYVDSFESLAAKVARNARKRGEAFVSSLWPLCG
jgi:hypothetical protein